MKWAWLVTAIIYFVPLLRAVFTVARRAREMWPDKRGSPAWPLSPNPDASRPRRCVYFCGNLIAEIEYYFAPFRRFGVGWPLTALLLGNTGVTVVRGATYFSADVTLYLAVFAALQFWFSRAVAVSVLRMADYLRAYRRVHPLDYYRLYKFELAYGVPRLFQLKPREIMPDGADFRSDSRPRQSPWIVFGALFDTVVCTKLVVASYAHFGPAFADDVSDAVGALWGKRMLERSHNQMIVRGLNKLDGRRGRFLIISNHKSTMDFIITFFAFSEVDIGQRRMRPRFIVAKDHFYDNPFLYGMLGIGRAISGMGMVFIERKNRARSFENLREAAHAIAVKDLDIAVYPQGTRAIGNFDRAGKRRDAGYYTTVNSRDTWTELAHLRKGTAYLIMDTLRELREHKIEGELNLVFVGIQGTAVTLPRGAFKVQTENTVEFNIGSVESLNPELAEALFDGATAEECAERRRAFVTSMNATINSCLERAMGLHAVLKKRFLTDLKGAFRFEPDKIEAVASALDRASAQSADVYRIIDRIYSLPPAAWNGYISRLCQLLQGRAEPERFREILIEVSLPLVA